MPIPLFDSPDIDLIRRQFQAWINGAVSRARNDERENPHPERSAEGDAWENGFEVIGRHLSEALRSSLVKLAEFDPDIPENAEKRMNSICVSVSGFTLLVSQSQVKTCCRLIEIGVPLSPFYQTVADLMRAGF